MLRSRRKIEPTMLTKLTIRNFKIFDEIEKALLALVKASPWGLEMKVSDDFLDPVFKRFYEKLDLPNLMTKTDYHRLAGHLAFENIDSEIGEKLDAILATACRAHPGSA